MFEGIMAKGQHLEGSTLPGPRGHVEAGPGKGTPPASEKSLTKRGSGRDLCRHVGFLLPGEEDDADPDLQRGIEASLAEMSVATASSSSSASRSAGKRAGKRQQSKRGTAPQLPGTSSTTTEGQRAIQEGESAVGLLVAELRALEDEVRRCERQRAVLYPEDVAAREELTAQIDELHVAIGDLQETVITKEQALIDLHLTHGTAADLDWQRVFALRTLKQQHWARRKGRKQERQEVLQANKSLNPNYNRSLRVTARQRTCTTCYRRFVVDDNADGCCHFHSGRFVHDDARCVCGGAIRHDRPTIDAEMAHYLKKQMLKTNGRLPSNVNIQVRRGLVCTFAYTCCGARDARTPGCATGKHTWRHFK
eukprot:EG_transcript_12976